MRGLGGPADSTPRPHPNGHTRLQPLPEQGAGPLCDSGAGQDSSSGVSGGSGPQQPGEAAGSWSRALQAGCGTSSLTVGFFLSWVGGGALSFLTALS